MLLGEKIKELRDEHGVLQRQLAALLEIDTPMFSKIERGDRRAKRTQVIQLAEYFKIDKNELLTLWLADKVLDAIEGEDELKQNAIKVAEEKMGEPYNYRELYGIIIIFIPDFVSCQDFLVNLYLMPSCGSSQILSDCIKCTVREPFCECSHDKVCG